jgi:gas vesicle protein
MAKATFHVPSLVGNGAWELTFDGGTAKWGPLWKAWRADDLISGIEFNRDVVIGQMELVQTPASPDRFGIPLTRGISHHERSAEANYPRNILRMWSRSAEKSLKYALHRSSIDQQLWLQLLPSIENLGSEDYEEVLNAAGLSPHRLRPKATPAYIEANAFFHFLEAKAQGGPKQPWYLLTRTQTRQGSASVNEPTIVFDALNLALRQTRGTQFAGRPFHGFVPSFFPVDKSFDPISLVSLFDRTVDGPRLWGATLLRVDLGRDAVGKELEARFDWHYSDRDGNDPSRTGFTLRGRLFDDAAAQYTRTWGPSGGDIHRTFVEMLAAHTHDATIASFKLHSCSVVDTGWLRMGSLEIRPLPVQDASCTLSFSARGRIGTGAIDVYPVVKLNKLKCWVRNAAGPDPQREVAQPGDPSTDRVDLLRRETTPIVGRLDPTSYREATLELCETTYVPGRDAHTRMKLVVEMSGAQRDVAVWLNLRPFMTALVDYAASSESHMALSWSSDDTAGAQWRVDNPLVTVVLPPQAVGEEMERGIRFYDKPDATDIKTDQPLPYRFSRGTYLRLRPSPIIENRRFEISPINLREIMRGSTIERMVVEMAYPLEVDYDRARDASRELRLVEAAEAFGEPAQALGGKEISSGEGLSAALNEFFLALPDLNKKAYSAALGELQAMQTSMQVNFQSRLAELHVQDPVRPRSDLRLGAPAVLSRLRHTENGAKPLISPLPNDALYTLAKDPATDFEKFLNPDGSWGTPAQGSIRGGLMHSFEFASEMESVLKKAGAVGTMVEALTLSALGATGRMDATFDNGKTSFAVVVEHGQLSRLVKTRIGRIGALWNRAKHVVVYERSAARSAQFQREQKLTDAFDGWPILRKMEEYVEPIEDRREFQKEAQKDANSTRFIEASAFETKRIYVNGAWGRDLGIGQGYELPLWDRTAARDDPRFYPRPRIFLDCHGEEGRMTRLWFADPDRIFFFSSAEPGTTEDTDKWNQRAGVDFDNLPRMPVLEESDVAADRMKPRTPANSDLCTSLRFDLAVEAEGQVDLAFGSGAAPQLVKLNRVFISRSSQSAPVSWKRIEDEPGLDAVVKSIRVTGAAQKSAASLAPSLTELSGKLRDRIEKEIYKYKGDPKVPNPCDHIRDELKRTVDDELREFRKALDLEDLLDLLPGQIQRTRAAWIAAAGDLGTQLQSRALLAEHVLAERARTLVKSLDELYARVADDSNPLPAEVVRQRDTFISEVQTLRLELKQRIDHQLGEVSQNIRNALEEAVKQAQEAVNALTTGSQSFEAKCRKACEHLAKAVGQIEKLPASTRRLTNAVANWLRFLSEQAATLADMAGYLGRIAPAVADAVVVKLGTLASAVLAVAKLLSDWAAGKLKLAADQVVAEVTSITDDVAADLAVIASATTGQAAREAIAALRVRVQGAGDNVLGRHRRAVSLLRTRLLESAEAIADELLRKTGTPPVDPIESVAAACKEACNKLGEFADELATSLKKVIDDGAKQCDQFVQTIQNELKEAEAWARRQADAALTEVLSSEAAQRAAQYTETATQVWDVGSKAVSLARAVGELPNLNPLKFDIDVAAYVFEGKKPEILMSPAVARLRQEGEELLDSLGLSIPCKELRDRIIPDFTDFNFNEVFNKFAGMDLKGLFNKFKLPALDSDKVKVSHGFDPKTRRAWANAKVDFEHVPYEELFAFGPVSLGLRRMKFDAFTGVDTEVGKTSVQTAPSRTAASLRADWLLQGAGQALVTFKEVAIRYDGADGFDFDVSPDNIELHPSLKFVTEIVEKLQDELPPAVQIEMKNGRPIGVSAGTTIVVDNPPDLGAVSIGPIDIRSSLALLIDDGRFSIRSAFSLGSKQKPIFVQITWLGGGCWLEARAKYVDGTVTPSISIGLAVGATRTFNLASVAKGSFSVLLYCYIEIERSNDSVAIGLSITGSALIIGFVNANVSLLLEAKHSKGKMEGTGRLDVSVKISWFYTFRFKQAVKHKF